MRLPGFTAEVSLAKTATDSREAPMAAAGKDGKEVVPQLFCYRQGRTICCWVPYSGFVCHVIHTVA